jgi:hypothetical protein
MAVRGERATRSRWRAASLSSLPAKGRWSITGTLGLGRNIGFDGQQVGEGTAFLVGELSPVAVRVEHGLTLRRRQLAKIAKGMGNQSPTVLGKLTELLHRTAKLLTLVWREALHQLRALSRALELFRRHIVELYEPVAETILSFRRKIAKAWFILKCPLLLREGKVAVSLHPLRQMILILPLAAPGTGTRSSSH